MPFWSARLFDLDADGVINSQDLYALLSSILGEGYTDQQLDRVVQSTMAQVSAGKGWVGEWGGYTMTQVNKILDRRPHHEASFAICERARCTALAICLRKHAAQPCRLCSIRGMTPTGSVMRASYLVCLIRETTAQPSGLCSARA